MSETPDQLLNLRAQINQLDEQLIEVLGERFEISRLIGEFKRKNGLPALDEAREAAIMEDRTALAVEYGLDRDFAHRFVQMILDQVVAEHEEISQYKSPPRGRA